MLTEQKRVQYLYEELVKCLLVLSLPAHDQLEIHGAEGAGTVMSVELDTYYRVQRPLYEEHKLLTPEVIHLLNELDGIFRAHTGPEGLIFRNGVHTHPAWTDIRKLAASCLKAMGEEGTGIRVKFGYSKTYFPGEEPVTGPQGAEIRLTKKV